MSLVEQVAADLMAAMKARNDAKLSALRMLKAEFQKLQADKGVGVKIADEDAQAVIRRLIKQRKEAAEQFKAGGALDRAEAELSDIKFLEPYLPAQLDDAELDKLIEAAAAEVGASSVKDMGKLMKAVMSKAKGLADGSRVKEKVNAFLNK